jgi:hypothetical protein
MKIKYNWEYDRYVTEDGEVFRYSKLKKTLVCCSKNKTKTNYLFIHTLGKKMYLHRLVWETFNSKIPENYEIDHIDGNKQNNTLINLRCVNHKENINNPNTITKNRGRVLSDFGKKFKEHYGITRYENLKLYNKEYLRYFRSGKCSWEK